MIWGGRNLERWLGKALPPDKKIGETWEASDESVVENGEHRGETLASLVRRDGHGVLGTTPTVEGRFPLLLKFIDAQDTLSLQVHPDDLAAQGLDHYPFGKTEAWYVIHAEPGARLIHGFQVDASPELVRDYLGNEKLADLLAEVPVQSGDVVFVPPGTVHAITRGIILAEIQENSDLTYRLSDWGRRTPDGKTRELHIDKSLKVANYRRLDEHKIPSLTIRQDEFDRQFLVVCRYFSFELFDVRAPITNIPLNDRFNIVSAIQGSSKITYGENFQSTVEAVLGQTVLLPAHLGAFGITPESKPCKLLRAFVPDLHSDVIEPLARAGHSAASIARLGGTVTEQNDLLSFLQR
jgi:mannose-6-phosphate isomerase